MANTSAYKAFNNNDPYLGVTKEELDLTTEELDFEAFLDKLNPGAKLTRKELDWGTKIFDRFGETHEKIIGSCYSKADIKRLTNLRNITRVLAIKAMKRKEYVVTLALFGRAATCSHAINSSINQNIYCQ